ncbi:MAG: di-trans,poly-cis-decaprenylcistransferase [Rickettsiales bacterium]|jgi:undecaprenyl diphosphate synthase|nr:di-trans,poly-cis-decaprenylcistransferase [Rickettsiales bacterium]
MENELKIPRHLGIIMDGNRRWAVARGLPKIAGHRYGVKAMERVLAACRKFGVKTVTLYAFSSENWGRAKEEVDALMGIFSDYLENRVGEFLKEKTRFVALGDRSRFSEKIRKSLAGLEEKSRDFSDLTLNMALGYDGREEIAMAVRSIAADVKAGKLGESDITPDLISGRLYTAGQPDPDFIIRTSGEQRLSGFLLWQCSYAELYFPDFFFPDFSEEKLREAFEEYSKRERRYGKG